jgi:3-oxoacyl-[acyl-carrier protein] reductase
VELGLNGKTALVTGGGRGIGRAIALALAAEGVDVAIAGRDPERTTEAELKALGSRSFSIPVDLARRRAVEQMVETAITTFGHLDLFVSNAGGHRHEPVTRLTEANVNHTMNVNLKACMWACRDVARHMLARGTGSMLIVASTIQFHPGYSESAYRITKVGLRAFAETMAIELGPYGIRVNTLSPGLFPTRLSEGLGEVITDPEIGPPLLQSISLRRLGRPEECGAIAAMLLSDRASSYVTGADVVVDGGYHLRPLMLMRDEQVLALNAGYSRRLSSVGGRQPRR